LEASPLLSNLSPADFYLFPRLELAWKGRSFFDAIDITENSREELKGISENGFQECFQRFYSRWQKCIFSQGDYTGKK
jgi:hypothetical protein